MERPFMDFSRPRSGNANNLLTSIRSNVRKHPDTAALVCNDLRRTWKEVWERTNQLGNSLLELGLNRGDRVAMVMKNGVEFSETFIATAKAGLIKVPMNYNLKEVELAYQLNDCEASALFVHPEFLNRVRRAAKEVPTLRTIIVVGEGAPGNMVSYEALVAKGSQADMEMEISPNDIEILLYTSGTTGRPKGVIRGFAENYHVGMSYCVEAGISSESVLLTVPPQYHVGPCGTFWATLVGGGTQVILEKRNRHQGGVP